MRAQWYSSLTCVLLLSFNLCITELIDNCNTPCERIKEESKMSVTPYDNGFDVLNPIYIFK